MNSAIKFLGFLAALAMSVFFGLVVSGSVFLMLGLPGLVFSWVVGLIAFCGCLAVLSTILI